MTSAGRGISLLDTEPARAGQNLLFAFLILELVRKDSLKLGYWLILLFVQIALIRSATGLVFTVLSIITIYNNWRFNMFFAFASVIVLFSGFPSVNSRGLGLMVDIVSVKDFDLLWSLILNESGFRGISIYSSYLYGFSHAPCLFGSWEIRSLEALRFSGFDSDMISYFRNRGGYHSVRPPSYFAHLFLEFGFLTFPIIYVFFLRLFKSKNQNGFKYIVVPVICLFCLGSIGNPLPWLCLSLFFNRRDI